EPVPGLHLAWWNDAGDAVFLIGTHDPIKVIKSLQQKNLTTHPLFKEIQGFEEFTTCARGYLDMPSLVKAVGKISPDVTKLISELGLDGVKTVTFHSGFDGPFERSVLEIQTPGERKGLLKLAGRRAVKLADLPPLPDDLTSFSVASVELGETYDVIVNSIE